MDVLTDLPMATEEVLGAPRSPIEMPTNSQVRATYETGFSPCQF